MKKIVILALLSSLSLISVAQAADCNFLRTDLVTDEFGSYNLHTFKSKVMTLYNGNQVSVNLTCKYKDMKWGADCTIDYNQSFFALLGIKNVNPEPAGSVNARKAWDDYFYNSPILVQASSLCSAARAEMIKQN